MHGFVSVGYALSSAVFFGLIFSVPTGDWQEALQFLAFLAAAALGGGAIIYGLWGLKTPE